MSQFNLLPGDYRKKRSKLLAPLSAMVTVLFIITALILLEGYLSYKAKAISYVEVGRLENKLGQELRNLSGNADKVRNKIMPYVDLITKHHPWSNVLVGIAHAMGDPVWLTQLSLSSEEGVCVLNGKARSTEAVFGLVEALERLEFINKARLNSMHRKSEEETRNVIFEIKCHLNKIPI